LSPSDSRALLYGESVFTTLRVDGGKALFLAAHQERLRRSAEWLWPGANWVFPPTPPGSGVWRIQLAARGERGQWRAPIAPTLAVETSWYEGLLPATILSLQTVALPGRSANWPAFSKTPDYLERVIAARGLTVDPLFLVAGHVTELLHHNVFFVFNDTLVTPPEGPNVLAGIGRARVLALAQHHAWPVEIRPVALGELAGLQGAFAVNAVRGICPVERIDGHGAPAHPWRDTLTQEFFLP
jgi:branched-subunit amino acid aminotransferase/4-amino-4-deoxychorismate lyase